MSERRLCGPHGAPWGPHGHCGGPMGPHGGGCAEIQYNLVEYQPWDPGSLYLCLQDCILAVTLVQPVCRCRDGVNRNKHNTKRETS